MLSKISTERLSTCHPDLIKLVTVVSDAMDIMVICGQRNEADQNKAFSTGNSKLRYPHSKHNKTPSLAVDCAPLQDGKIDWADIAAFREMVDLFKEFANDMGIKIECGADWKFKDFPHIQLAGGE